MVFLELRRDSRLFSSCGVRASHCRGFSLWSMGSRVQASVVVVACEP